MDGLANVDYFFTSIVSGFKKMSVRFSSTVGVSKMLTVRFRLYCVNTIRCIEKKNDYETVPYQGDNRVDKMKEAFFTSTKHARKAFRRQRREFFRMLAFSKGQSTPVTFSSNVF